MTFCDRSSTMCSMEDGDCCLLNLCVFHSSPLNSPPFYETVINSKVCLTWHKCYMKITFLSGYLFPLQLTSVSCHVAIYFQRVSIVLRVDPVLPVSFRIPRVSDVLTGMSRMMRIPTFCFELKQKEILIFSSRRET